MTSVLAHPQVREMLVDAALDALGADEQVAALAHAVNCPECGPALVTLRNALAQLAHAVPSVSDDPLRRARVRARLLARARADVAVARVDQSPAAPFPPPDVTALNPTGGRRSGPSNPLESLGGAPQQDRLAGEGRGGRNSWLGSVALAWGALVVVGVAALVYAGVLTARVAEEGRAVTRARAADAAQIARLRDSLATQSAMLRALTEKDARASERPRTVTTRPSAR